MRDAGYIQKESENSHHKYKYASAEAVFAKVRNAMVIHGCSIVSSGTEVLFHESKEKDPGKYVWYTTVRTTITVGDGAETATFQGIGTGSDNQDKSAYKAETGALKYAIAKMVLMSWGDDAEATDSEGRATSAKRAAKDWDWDGEIASAETLAALEALRDKVVGLKGTEKYTPATSAYKAKAATFKEEK
jgi:hypothetical protein